MGQAKIRKMAGDTHEARAERAPQPQRILELAQQVAQRVGTEGIEFVRTGSGRCWLWAVHGRDVLTENGVQVSLKVGKAVVSFGAGSQDLLDFGYTMGGVHYWLTLADGTVIDFSAADLPQQRACAHASLPMSKAAMQCEVPKSYDSRTCKRLPSPTSVAHGFAMLHRATGDGEAAAESDIRRYRLEFA